jgi:hypothetical protein
MRRVLLFLTVAALALVGTSDSAIAASDITVRFAPALKYTGINSSSVKVDILIDNYHVPACDPTCGLDAYDLWVVFDPAVISYVSFVNGEFLGRTGNTPVCVAYPPSTPNVTGPNQARLQCTTWAPQHYGPRGSGTLATITFASPATTGTSTLTFDSRTELVTVYLGQYYRPAFEEGNGSVVVATLGSGDSDGDGCTDTKEVGYNPALGGWRNPFDANDFYDVPSPTLHDGGTLSNRDKVITSAKDLPAVLKYVSSYAGGPANSLGVDYDDLYSGKAEGLAYDRSNGVEWSGAPDGYISVIGDAMELLPQMGHDCR